MKESKLRSASSLIRAVGSWLIALTVVALAAFLVVKGQAGYLLLLAAVILAIVKLLRVLNGQSDRESPAGHVGTKDAEPADADSNRPDTSIAGSGHESQ